MEVGEFRTALCYMAHFLHPALQALYDASFHSMGMVGLKVGIVVCMCLLPEHRCEDVGALVLH